MSEWPRTLLHIWNVNSFACFSVLREWNSIQQTGLEPGLGKTHLLFWASWRTQMIHRSSCWHLPGMNVTHMLIIWFKILRLTALQSTTIHLSLLFLIYCSGFKEMTYFPYKYLPLIRLEMPWKQSQLHGLVLYFFSICLIKASAV